MKFQQQGSSRKEIKARFETLRQPLSSTKGASTELLGSAWQGKGFRHLMVIPVSLCMRPFDNIFEATLVDTMQDICVLDRLIQIDIHLVVLELIAVYDIEWGLITGAIWQKEPHNRLNCFDRYFHQVRPSGHWFICTLIECKFHCTSERK